MLLNSEINNMFFRAWILDWFDARLWFGLDSIVLEKDVVWHSLYYGKKQINVRSRDYDTGRFMIIARYRVHA